MEMRGLNPGLLTCEASTLPLSYSPVIKYAEFKNIFDQNVQFQKSFKVISLTHQIELMLMGIDYFMFKCRAVLMRSTDQFILNRCVQ